MTDADEREAVAAVEQLAAACVAVVETSVVSTILHGSLTLDDFQRGRSDLDLLIVVDGPLTESEAEALVAVVREADPGPAGGIDLLVVTRASAAVPEACLELQVGRGHGSSELEVERRNAGVPDLWAELSMARADGRALRGAEPREVIGEVPRAALRDRGVHWLTRWLDLTDDEKNAPFMVLTACRIWRFVAEGRHASKSAAARWALERDPTLVAVEQARSQRLGTAHGPLDPDDVRRVLETVLHQVETLSRKTQA